MDILLWLQHHWVTALLGVISLDYAVLLSAKQFGYDGVVNVATAVLRFLGFIYNIVLNFGKQPVIPPIAPPNVPTQSSKPEDQPRI